jgi:hypothetical protein
MPKGSVPSTFRAEAYTVISPGMTVANVKQVACYLTPTQIKALKKLSAASGAPMQYYLRLAVDDFIKKQKKKKPAQR